MSARILVVDDIAANVRLLEAKLMAEYYEVITASDGHQALEVLGAEPAPDLVLLDVMMPGLNGFEVCQAIKENPATTHIPVVMVTALGEVRDRVQGLEAGADDFLTKPVRDAALFARIKSLVRLKRSHDELSMRESLSHKMCGEASEAPIALDAEPPSEILLVQDPPVHSCRITEALTARGHQIASAASLADATQQAETGRFALFLVNDTVGGEDALRFCAQLRAHDATRHASILLMIPDGDDARMAKALELGVNDYLVRPVDRDELIARTRTQIRRKLYEDRLRAARESTLAAALADSLTGLYNRRYLDAHFQALSARMARGGKDISLLLLDIDHFKEINDTHGHAIGDEILCGLADRISASVRGFDTPVRFGGEEFVVLLPETSAEAAAVVAERLCQAISLAPFAISKDPQLLPVTVSIGVASVPAGAVPRLESLLERADAALYRAKDAGRNCVMMADNFADTPAKTGLVSAK